jgi:hypothetical protein
MIHNVTCFVVFYCLLSDVLVHRRYFVSQVLTLMRSSKETSHHSMCRRGADVQIHGECKRTLERRKTFALSRRDNKTSNFGQKEDLKLLHHGAHDHRPGMAWVTVCHGLFQQQRGKQQPSPRSRSRPRSRYIYFSNASQAICPALGPACQSGGVHTSHTLTSRHHSTSAESAVFFVDSSKTVIKH